MKATEWLTSDHVTKILEQSRKERAMSLKAFTAGLDHIQRGLAILEMEGKDTSDIQEALEPLVQEMIEEVSMQNKAMNESHIAGFMGHGTN